ncbi:MAG: pyridoxamine 5'-phosphate oxidase family protein [Candidatus Kerfeldbacteria bacterium]|nr:pyridoxamine 5'-phosphate oxidase family protein [Candidatus Kerfeldbacteria bacterium]
MKQKECITQAISILKSNKYLTLATTDGVLPWVAPVYYCLDEDYNFYFISQLESVHVKHILQKPNVAFAIFDSHQPEGEGNGVQGSGTVTLLQGDAMLEGLNYYSTSFIDIKPEYLVESAPYRLFKITPEHFYVLDADAEVDKRVEVFIHKKNK